MTTEIDNKIFILETVDVRLPESQQTTKYDFMNTNQLYFMIEDYIDITCQEVSQHIFGEQAEARNNIELVYDQIDGLMTEQAFDAELVGPDGDTILGKITIARIK